MRALDAAGVAATDVHRRQATLDDVFLTLTAHPPARRLTARPPHDDHPRRPRPRGRQRARWLVSDSLALARRNLEHVRQIPEKLLDVTLQPIMFVLLFAYVFGGVIAVPDGDYRDYLIGGILVQTLAFGMMGPGDVDRHRPRRGHRRPLPLAADVAVGVPARALPRRAGRGAGRASSSSGHRARGRLAHRRGRARRVAGFALLVLFAAAMIWVGTLHRRDRPLARRGAGLVFMAVFPLTFLSNAFVPAAGLPDGLQQVAEWNPVSAVVAAVRTLFGNPTAMPADAPWPLAHPVLAAVLWSLAILAVAVPLTIRRFKRAHDRVTRVILTV